METQEFERFGIYGFKIAYPKICQVQFNAKSRREDGDVAFQFPNKDRIFLTWGSLQKLSGKLHSVEEHAEFSLNTISKTKGVKGLERLSRDSVMVNSHRAAYNSVRLEQAPGGLLIRPKAISQSAFSFHIHCENSSRYFVIYTLVSEAESQEFSRLMRTMVDSFKCHQESA